MKKIQKYMHAHGERPNPHGWVGVHTSYICTYMYAHAESIVISKKNTKKTHYTIMTLYACMYRIHITIIIIHTYTGKLKLHVRMYVCVPNQCPSA